MATRVLPALIALILLWPHWARAEQQATPALMGALGLNTVPSARMDPVGTVRAAASTMDPYLNAQLGLQIAAPLYIGLRQTAEISSLRGRALRLFPGMDIKLRLHEKGPVAPEISAGLQSAFGARRMAGEYLALSKRYGNFDFTGGIGWGRLGGAGRLPNPFGLLGGHFRKDRAPDSPLPEAAGDWFTGRDAGLFGGVEYFLPFFDRLSLKADWSTDGYEAEKASFDYHAPKPWSVGVSYRPEPWLNLGTAFVGGNKVMGTLSVQEPLGNWPHRYKSESRPAPLNPARAGEAQPAEMERAAAADRITLYGAGSADRRAYAMLDIDGNSSLPQQIGRAARPMANNAGAIVEELDITPVRDGLRGPTVSLNRRDLEAAMARHNGSPEEIWRDAFVAPQSLPTAGERSWLRPFLNGRPEHFLSTFHLTLDNDVSLAENDSGVLYRTSLIAELREQVGAHVVTGTALRLNLKDNLSQLEDIRPPSFPSVRGDVDRFAAHRAALDRFYSGWLTSITPNLHFAASAGLLEEMYTGAGAEILWRPFGKTFALGAEAWSAYKRDPLTPLSLGVDNHVLTGHVNAYYEIPNSDLTLEARVGRYLAGDFGGTLAVARTMDNGVKVRGFITATNQSDVNIFGAPANLYSGVEITLPFGDRRYLPPGSALRLAASPLGRDAGQTLDNPLPLYELTEPFSERQIIRHWNDITE
jgi:hypothetical protein